MKRGSAFLVVGMLVAVAGCQGEMGEDVLLPDEVTTTASDLAAWTTGAVTRTGVAPGVNAQTSATLVDIRMAKHASYERTVYEFSTAHLPAYRVEYIDNPVHCATGDLVNLSGRAFLSTAFEGAQAHDLNTGASTLATDGRQLRFQSMQEYSLTCDYEGHVVVDLALDKSRAIRVFELKSPSRLVIDVQYDVVPVVAKK